VSGILIMAEQRRGELRPVSLELIGAAQALRRSGDPVAVAILASAPNQFIEPVKLAGVDEIVAVKVESAEFDPDTFEAVAAALIAERKPDVVLVAHSVDSFGYAPALAAKLGLGFASDVFKVERIEGELVATRGGYGQKVNVEVDFPGRATVLLALRANVFKPPGRPRLHRARRRRRRRHDPSRVHLDHRPRHRRGIEHRTVQGAGGCRGRNARVLSADRGCGLASEEPPGRPVRQDRERL
jgi:electron transfer flavoprotein alpha subunit